MKFLKIAIASTILFSINVFAADLTRIFGPDSRTTPQVAAYVTDWLTRNCKDMERAVSVTEIPERSQVCGRGIEKVHLDVQFSHLHSEMIIWVKSAGTRSVIDWIYEEQPDWHLCTYMDSFARDDKTCRYYP